MSSITDVDVVKFDTATFEVELNVRVASRDGVAEAAEELKHDAQMREMGSYRTGWLNRNIYVDGKSSSCWIDRDGRIGSSKKGGPFISNWIRFYGNDWKTTIKAIKEIYPAIAELDERNKQRERSARRAS